MEHTERPTDIVSFLATRQQQLITSMAMLGNEFSRIQQVDDFHIAVYQRFEIASPNDLIMALLMRATHRQFYVAIAQYLHTEFTEAMASLRHGIEDGMILAFMGRHPEAVQDFRKRDSEIYREVYFNIKRYMKANLHEYPKVESLIPLHERASQIASHSTFEWFAKKTDFSDPSALAVQYLEPPENEDELRYYFYFFLATNVRLVELVDEAGSAGTARDILTPEEREQLQQIGAELEHNKRVAYARMENREQGPDEPSL